MDVQESCTISAYDCSPWGLMLYVWIKWKIMVRYTYDLIWTHYTILWKILQASGLVRSCMILWSVLSPGGTMHIVNSWKHHVRFSRKHMRALWVWTKSRRWIWSLFRHCTAWDERVYATLLGYQKLAVSDDSLTRGTACFPGFRATPAFPRFPCFRMIFAVVRVSEACIRCHVHTFKWRAARAIKGSQGFRRVRNPRKAASAASCSPWKLYRTMSELSWSKKKHRFSTKLDFPV
jgi:hypothetical protein